LKKLPQFFYKTEETGKAGGDSQKRNDGESLKEFLLSLLKTYKIA
jgi:hypothetical protein